MANEVSSLAISPLPITLMTSSTFVRLERLTEKVSRSSGSASPTTVKVIVCVACVGWKVSVPLVMPVKSSALVVSLFRAQSAVVVTLKSPVRVTVKETVLSESPSVTVASPIERPVSSVNTVTTWLS